MNAKQQTKERERSYNFLRIVRGARMTFKGERGHDMGRTITLFQRKKPKLRNQIRGKRRTAQTYES